MDYRTYQLKCREWLACIGAGVLIAIAVSWLLYRSVYGMVLAVLFVPLCINYWKQRALEKRKQELLLEFKDAMQSVAAALMAGYSMENAWRAAEQEIRELYGEAS